MGQQRLEFGHIGVNRLKLKRIKAVSSKEKRTETHLLHRLGLVKRVEEDGLEIGLAEVQIEAVRAGQALERRRIRHV